jgi:8-amino-7-oxononanoate synthase
MPDSEQPLAWIDDELATLDAHALRRYPIAHCGPQGAEIEIDGRRCVNFGANDYLGLAADPRLAAAARECLACEGWGSAASPLLAGRSAAQARLEAELADFEDAEAALVFSSGFAANLAVIPALVERGDAVFADEMNHASLIDGCRLSRATIHIYPHGNWRELARLLAENHSVRRRLIVTDALFSMDGDLAPLAELAELAEHHHAMLMVDEAHAIGVFGASGRGVAEHLGVARRIDIRVGTLSKALGGAGGFVFGRRSLIEWLANRARPYMFSTAPPAAACAAALAALRSVRSEPDRRHRVLDAAGGLRAALAAQGWDVGRSAGPIIPVVLGEARAALDLAEQLLARGLHVPAIRPPSVPAGQSRLRISLSAAHDATMIARLVEALAEAAVPRSLATQARP